LCCKNGLVFDFEKPVFVANLDARKYARN